MNTPRGVPEVDLARSSGVIACHECDLLQRERPLPVNGVLHCCRCRAALYRRHVGSLDRALAYSIAALALFVLANIFPIVGLSVNGDLVETTLFGSVHVLYRDGMWPLALLIFVTTLLMPALQAAGIVWLLLPLRLGRRPYRADRVFRLLHIAQSWGMTEVLILGLLVALVKLAHIASVVPDIALWSFIALMLLLAAAAAAFDPRDLWARLEGPPEVAEPEIVARGNAAAPAFPARTAAGCGRCVCHDCGLLSPPLAGAHRHDVRCARCGSRLHVRKPNSLARTWAFLLAALVLYLPANLLPVMHTSSLFGAQKDTIMSGVVYLWTSGSWPLAVLVFIASIAVPMLKILAIAFLAGSANLGLRWQPVQRARIYRLVELVGRWSMLDIYVIAILTALVQFNALATITAGPAAIAFGAVVVLTMFAAMSFDPRLIWDTRQPAHGASS
ncbi:paraquat-inducible protein A [Paraburkholderia humisilvae]|uniref:Intermembrane transport protein PqiA n=1 Tax=Paraburkholderia humisilvae TaxID=627669 RepID=A0A6J5EAM1_9BURK|nr:paraquat-inducible protein A [Paraburkholderia humisilvae]CAB3762386.1 Intermembrane transport protein PqiA [Paraburkholderia humisilvae]